MKSFAWYDLQVIICSAIMMSYYFSFLRNKKFHQYNRFYILAVFLLSFMIPLIKIQLDKMNAEKAAMQFIYVLADYNASIEKSIASEGFQFSWNMIAIAVYISISVFFLFTFIMALVRIKKLLKQHEPVSFGDIFLVLTNVKGTPFSFFKYIFWNEEIDMQSLTGQQILKHELAHVQEKHSVDNITMQVVMGFGWFNPFFWLARKELHMIHEFIADKKSVNNGDTSSFAEMLLAASYPQKQFLLTNSFFFSPIKRRLLMITNNKNPRFSYLRRLVVLPLLAIVVMMFAFRTTPAHKEAFNQTISKNTSSDAAAFKEKAKNVNALNAKNLGKDTTIVLVSKDTTRKQPLYLLDGKKITHDEMSKIDPATIESINVLKDKTAVDKYGEDGKNGVVLINLKKNAVEKVEMAKIVPNFKGVEKPEVVVIGYSDKADKNLPIDKPRIIFAETQVHPEFVGGDEAWSKYLMHNLNRDLPMQKNAPIGKYSVRVSFVVNENGKVSDVLAENNPGYGTAEEAMRVVTESPMWKPAVQNGYTVACKTLQTITFVVSKQ